MASMRRLMYPIVAMGRQPRADRAADGTISTRATVGGRTWELIEAYAKRLEITPVQALRALMLYIEDLISDDQISWLGLDWQQSIRATRDKLGGLPLSLADIDQAKLHRSTKTKSGFVGVYANGAGFRATGRHAEYLGTYKTAIEAAAMRFLHYKKNGLPYGELELEIDRLRRDGEHGSDEQLREIALELARQCGTLHLFEEDAGEGPQMAGFAPGELEAAKQKLAERDAAEDLGWTIRRPDEP